MNMLVEYIWYKIQNPIEIKNDIYIYICSVSFDIIIEFKSYWNYNFESTLI